MESACILDMGYFQVEMHLKLTIEDASSQSDQASMEVFRLRSFCTRVKLRKKLKAHAPYLINI